MRARAHKSALPRSIFTHKGTRWGTHKSTLKGQRLTMGALALSLTLSAPYATSQATPHSPSELEASVKPIETSQQTSQASAEHLTPTLLSESASPSAPSEPYSAQAKGAQAKGAQAKDAQAKDAQAKGAQAKGAQAGREAQPKAAHRVLGVAFELAEEAQGGGPVGFEEGEVAHLRLSLSAEPSARLDERDPLNPTLWLESAELPKRLERVLDARSLNLPLSELAIYQAPTAQALTAQAPIAQASKGASEPARVALSARFERETPYSLTFVPHASGAGGELVWRFYETRDVSEAQRDGLAQSMSAPQMAPQVSVGGVTRSVDPRSLRRKKRYLGKRIRIKIKDADIHNVLSFLAECGRVNIVTSDEVKGTVTLMLNKVPWDQALDIILRTKGLDMVREGNIIRVAPREVIAAERKAELEKTQIKEQLKPILIRLVTVNHAEGKDMVDQVKGVLSERGTVTFDLRTNTLIVKDTEEHIEAAEDLVRRLDTQTPQVLIEARIVEVNKVNEQEFGIQWGGSFLSSGGSNNATGLSFPSSVKLSGGADDRQVQAPGVPQPPNFMVNLPATVGAGSGGALGLSFGNLDNTFNLNVRLSAAESRGTVKIISSPKITTLDNKRALISQGVSIPISQISAQGVQTTFFDATLSLEVTPHVTQDGNIYLQLKANNDTPDFQNVGSRGDPTILKKEASTQVLLQDGETTVIGGIYTSNAGSGRKEWPYFSKIPIIGALFRSSSERSQRNELLIFITPRVVNRLASKVNTR